MQNYRYKKPKLYTRTRECLKKCLPFLPLAIITSPYGLGIMLGLIYAVFRREHNYIKKNELDLPPLQRKSWIETNKWENLNAVNRWIKLTYPYVVFTPADDGIPCPQGGLPKTYVEKYGGVISDPSLPYDLPFEKAVELYVQGKCWWCGQTGEPTTKAKLYADLKRRYTED